MSDDTTKQRIELAAAAIERPLTIAALAMGGQGGAVLSDWIVALAEASGWWAQSTSVPGVAQRTGATIYYVEIMPARGGTPPVLSLTPMPGDLDIVLAAEYMEAGRAMLRGLVTRDRTTLIASTHRQLAVSEKEKPGDGTANSGAVSQATVVAAKRSILFDMEEIARRNGTVISASLFGALAGSGALPFSRSAFEAVVANSGRGVKQSLAAFAEAYDTAQKGPQPVAEISEDTFALPQRSGDPVRDALLARLETQFAPAAHLMLVAGLRKVVSYQDAAYAHDYLDRVGRFARLDPRPEAALTIAAAKHVANALCFDDIIHVAELKTRASRARRVRGEVELKPDQIVYTTEFLHPRMEEVVGTMPAALGRFFERRPRLTTWCDRFVDRGRRIRSGHLRGFLLLYIVSGLKRWRRGTLRFGREMAHLEDWLGIAHAAAATDYELAVEILNCRRLVKGYSDTHARGTSKFDRVMAAVPGLRGEPAAAEWLRLLMKAALADENGTALDGALMTVSSARNTKGAA